MALFLFVRYHNYTNSNLFEFEKHKIIRFLNFVRIFNVAKIKTSLYRGSTYLLFYGEDLISLIALKEIILIFCENNFRSLRIILPELQQI